MKEQDKDATKRQQWFLEAGFGLFIHWGPYSVAGVEASWPIMAPELASVAFGPQRAISEEEYVCLPARFNPVDYDPRRWVQLASQAGMKYLVFTAKHHDGFCMFDAPGTDYKITNTPYGQDVCAQLAEACAEAGMRLCFYYSPPDMHHPGYRDTTKPAAKNWLGEPNRPGWASYLDYMESHLRKLLTDYGPVSAIWFDGLSGQEKYDPARFRRLIWTLSPATLVNDRLGAEFDYITPEQFIPQDGVPIRQEGVETVPDSAFRLILFLLKVPGVRALVKRAARRYAEGELKLARVPVAAQPHPQAFQPWETCMTMNKTWAYNPRSQETKPAGELIRYLVEVASRGGNYLLNVGPPPEGSFPPEAEARLREIGRWMAVNGPAIHGTTYGPLQDLPFARTTARGDTIYLHVLDWPAEGRITLDGLTGRVSSVSLLAGDEPLAFDQDSGKLIIRGPARAPDEPVSVVAIRRGGSP
ncbi:MAG: alpha-L-fucosidase [Anaerolineae bacterium]|jgi:alpha-L-fucosidase